MGGPTLCGADSRPPPSNICVRSRKNRHAYRKCSVAWRGARGRPIEAGACFNNTPAAVATTRGSAVGPDLAGVAKRFSRDDLFTALLFPNRDVSPRYHTTLVETSNGKVLSGLVIYESVDGLTLRDSSNQTVRIEAGEIDARRDLPTSLMPVGLLDTLQPQDLADLYAYLQTL